MRRHRLGVLAWLLTGVLFLTGLGAGDAAPLDDGTEDGAEAPADSKVSLNFRGVDILHVTP